MVKANLGKKPLPRQPRLKPKSSVDKSASGKKKESVSTPSTSQGTSQTPKEYYHLKETDEFFTNYTDYSYKLSLLSRPLWECDMTGTKGLTYWQAKELEILIQTLIVQRFSDTLRREIWAPPLTSLENEKNRKAQLVSRAHHEYLSTFFPKEPITYKIPGTKNSKRGTILSEADPSFLSLTSEVVSGTNGHPATSLPQRAYNVKDSGSDNVSVLDSRWLTHAGPLKQVKLLPLRSLLNQIVNGVQLIPEVRKALKSGIPTQPGLRVEIPHKSVSVTNNGQSSPPVATFQKCKSLSSLYSRLGPSQIGHHPISTGLLCALEKLNFPLGITREVKESEVNGAKTLKEKEKEKKAAAAEALLKQKALEAAIKYPIEDLELLRNAEVNPRPQPELLSEDPNFQHIVKIWSYLISFGPHIGIPTHPLCELREEIELSCSQIRKRFPLEKLMVNLLENIVSEAGKITNLWIPQGINDIVEETTGFTIKEIGDWRKAPQPVPYNHWGRVLLGCIKELYCGETLPDGEEIIRLLEEIQVDQLDSKCTSYELIQRNYRASGAPLKEVPESTPITRQRKKTSRKKVKVSDDEESQDDEKEKDEDEEDPKRAEKWEPLIQQQFYRLSTDYKIQILSFLVEQSLGTSKLRSAFDTATEEITAKRKDRQELFKVRQECSDRITALNDEITKLNESYQAFYEDPTSVDSDRVDTESPDPTAEGPAPKKFKPSKSQSRKEAASLRLAIQTKNDEKLRQENKEIKAKAKSDHIVKEMEKIGLTLTFRSLGEDRFYNRYYYLPGTAFVSRQSLKHAPVLLVESTLPTPELAALLSYPASDLLTLRTQYEGSTALAAGAHWSYYADRTEIDALLKWLNPKGHRERPLRLALQKLSENFPPTRPQ